MLTYDLGFVCYGLMGSLAIVDKILSFYFSAQLAYAGPHNYFLLKYYDADYVIIFVMTMFIKNIINSPFIRKHDTKSILIKLDTEVNFQGLKLLPKEFSMFAVAKLRSIEFLFSKKTVLPVTCFKGT